MKKIYIVLTIILLLGGCVNSRDLLTEQNQNAISDNAETVILNYGGDEQGLYDSIYQTLLDDGFRIAHENEKRGSISTEGKDVGQSTMLRMQIVITDKTDGKSTAKFRGQWKGGEDAEMTAQAFSGLVVNSDYEKASWGDTGRPERAFAYMYKFAAGLADHLEGAKIATK